MVRTDLVELFSDISVCQLLDALGDDWLVETSIRPIAKHFRICGQVRSVSCPPNDNLTLHHALELATPGDILVVENGGGQECALWGELMSTSALQRGLAGTIIDGACRDQLEIQRLKYPVFCRGFSPRKCNKEVYGALGAPILVGCLEVRSNDFVIADVNGIVKIPLNDLEEAAVKVQRVKRTEEKLLRGVKAGRTVFDMLALGDRVATDQ